MVVDYRFSSEDILKMYEYLSELSADLWLSVVYILLCLGAACYLISMGLTSLKFERIVHVARRSYLKTSLMCFAQAVVCLIIVSNFFVPLYSEVKVTLTLIMFIFTYTARYYYLRNVSEVFKERYFLRWVYNAIVFGAIGACVIHLIWLYSSDVYTCCLGYPVQKTNPVNYILQVQIPFKMNETFSRFISFFTISVSLVYLRLFTISFKTRDKFMIVGLFLSVANIFYTTSFHAFGFKYWIPLYFIVDLLEYTRLQQIELSEYAREIHNQDLSYRMMIHDIANPLQINSVRLEKLRKRPAVYDSKDVKAIYNGTRSAIDILKHYNGQLSEEATISQVVEEVKSIFNDSNIIYQPPAKEVSVPRVKIKNILINLIKNSHEALEHELEWIKIKAHNIENGLELKIIDNGKYSNIKHPNRLLKGFVNFRRSGRGLGLLSIKKEIESVSGSFMLEEEDSNTCFKIIL